MDHFQPNDLCRVDRGDLFFYTGKNLYAAWWLALDVALVDCIRTKACKIIQSPPMPIVTRVVSMLRKVISEPKYSSHIPAISSLTGVSENNWSYNTTKFESGQLFYLVSTVTPYQFEGNKGVVCEPGMSKLLEDLFVDVVPEYANKIFTGSRKNPGVQEFFKFISNEEECRKMFREYNPQILRILLARETETELFWMSRPIRFRSGQQSPFFQRVTR